MWVSNQWGVWCVDECFQKSPRTSAQVAYLPVSMTQTLRWGQPCFLTFLSFTTHYFSLNHLDLWAVMNSVLKRFIHKPCFTLFVGWYPVTQRGTIASEARQGERCLFSKRLGLVKSQSQHFLATATVLQLPKHRTGFILLFRKWQTLRCTCDCLNTARVKELFKANDFNVHLDLV